MLTFLTELLARGPNEVEWQGQEYWGGTKLLTFHPELEINSSGGRGICRP